MQPSRVIDMGCLQSSNSGSDSEDVVMSDVGGTRHIKEHEADESQHRLELLPLEVRVEILKHVDNPKDLCRFIQTSKGIHDAFEFDRTVIQEHVAYNAFPGMNYHDAVYAIKAGEIRRSMLEGLDTCEQRWMTPTQAAGIKGKLKIQSKAFLDEYHALKTDNWPRYGVGRKAHDRQDPKSMFKLWYLIDHFADKCAKDCASELKDQLENVRRQEREENMVLRQAHEMDDNIHSDDGLSDGVQESRLITSVPSQNLTCHFEQTIDGPRLVIHQTEHPVARAPTTDRPSPPDPIELRRSSSSPLPPALAPRYDPLPSQSAIDSATTLPISRLEYARLQRAFLRLEVHRRALPLAAWSSYIFSHRFQGCRFFGGFTPWEREEMLCAWHYLRRYTLHVMYTIRSSLELSLLAHEESASSPVQPGQIAIDDDVLRDVGWHALLNSSSTASHNSVVESQRLPLLGLPFLHLLMNSSLEKQRQLLNEHGSWRRPWQRHVNMRSAMVKSNAHDTHPSAQSLSRRHARAPEESTEEEIAVALPSAGWKWSRQEKMGKEKEKQEHSTPEHRASTPNSPASTSRQEPGDATTTTTSLSPSTTNGIATATVSHPPPADSVPAPPNTSPASDAAPAQAAYQSAADLRKRNECARYEDSGLQAIGYVFWDERRLAAVGVLERDANDLTAGMVDTERIDADRPLSLVERLKDKRFNAASIEKLKVTGSDIFSSIDPMKTSAMVEACEYDAAVTK